MNTNPYLEFKELLQELKKKEKKPTLLIHSCCGPCSTYPLSILKDIFDITIYYYNPNIYPKEEFEKRAEEEYSFIKRFDPSIKMIKEEANYQVYLDEVAGYTHLEEGSKRCYQCYQFRIKKTSEVATTNGFDYYSTVMSVSPYKNSDWINELGKKYELGAKFLYSNFKKEEGYKKSIQMSKEYDLYRQDYCGCAFSMIEHAKRLENK